MLTNLLIKNYALIRNLEMRPSPGLNIVTGETGAGKSIMLGAVGLLLGNRADTKVLLQKDRKCVIEGTFDLKSSPLESLFAENDWEYEAQTIIRREINTSGKSRAFINDSPVNLDALKSLGKHLLDIHSQNDTLQLGAQVFQLNVIDLYGQHLSELDQYRETHRRWKQLKNKKEALLEQSKSQQKEADYRNFLLEELDSAQLEPEEQATLESSLQLMENAEEIKSQIHNSLQALDGPESSINEQLTSVNRTLSKIKDYSPQYQSLHSRLHSALIELQDVAQELNSLEQQIEYNPQEIEEKKARLDLIYRLQQKHQVQSIAELMDIQRELDNQAQELLNLDVTLANLEKDIEKTEALLIKLGQALTQCRKKVFEPFKEKMEGLLHKLGMPEAFLGFNHQKISPRKDGLDDISWTFSANKGIPPQPINKVASGGEFSRLMFCVKYLLADKVSLPSILFDEIDSGISGEVALQMVKMMQEMASSHQVITISHLPQFAAKGDHHYYVYKESSGVTTTSEIKRLEGEERVQEVAKMLGGNNPSDIAYANAKELLQPSN